MNLKDRVKETTTTTGTGTVSLAGASIGFRSFLTAFGSGVTTDVPYCISSGAAFEIGRGTYDGTAGTLARTTVEVSSNADALVNFGAGTKDVFCVASASALINDALSFPKAANPVFPCFAGGAETSRIVNGSVIETFVFNGVNLSYAEMTDARCAQPGTLAATGDADARFGNVFKVGVTYYQTYQRAADGQIGLKKSTDKTTWTVINGGNPVLSVVVGTIYQNLWNTGVIVDGNTWHFWVECGLSGDQSDVGIAYSYGTFSADTINFDANKTSVHVIPGGGQPNPVVIDNHLVMLHGSVFVKGRTLWEIRAATARLTSDWSESGSYLESPYFQIRYTGMHTADPDFVDFGAGKSHRLGIGFMHNQVRSDLLYLDMTPTQFLYAVLHGYYGDALFGISPSFDDSISANCTSGSVTLGSHTKFLWQIRGNRLEFNLLAAITAASTPGGRLSINLPFYINPLTPFSGVCHAYNLNAVNGTFEFEISGSVMYIDRLEGGAQLLDTADYVKVDSTFKCSGVILF